MQTTFVLEADVSAGNVHDSTMFDDLYKSIITKFPEVEKVALDASYKTPWIMKQIFDSGRLPYTPYKRPKTKKGFFKKYEYVYDESHNRIICPNNQVLKYSTTNREGYREYKSNPKICASCPHIKKCTESKNHQKIVLRHINERRTLGTRLMERQHTACGAKLLNAFSLMQRKNMPCAIHI